jgi:DNA invertase Pin-like site-specific DNA recombinase
MKTVLYCRVSTIDQTLAHQRSQAHAAGFRPDLVLADHGVSGVSTRLCERPEGRRLFDVLREGDILVVRWLDRLGRNYQDVTDTIREFIRRGTKASVLRQSRGRQASTGNRSTGFKLSQNGNWGLWRRGFRLKPRDRWQSDVQRPRKSL